MICGLWGTNWVDIFNQLQNYPLLIIFQGKQSRCCIRWRTLRPHLRRFPRPQCAAGRVTFVWWSLVAACPSFQLTRGRQRGLRPVAGPGKKSPQTHYKLLTRSRRRIWSDNLPRDSLCDSQAGNYGWDQRSIMFGQGREEGGGAGVTSVFKAQRISVNISRAGTMHARDTRLDWRDLKPNSKPRATLSRLMVVICSTVPQLLANRCL